MNHSKPYTRSDELHMAAYASVVQGSRKKPMSGTAQLSKARESRLLKTQMTNSASRGEISAKRATKQAMGVTLSPQRRRAVRIERGCPLPATCHRL